MADSLASVIDLLHPTVSGVGIITTDQLWILFDREIDETTIAGGNFFATGPDFDTWSGPDLQLFHDFVSIGDEEEVLQSPGFEGILQGEITFERISLTSFNEVTTQDTIGSGHLYRTKAILTPTNRLQANTSYIVYLSGDEDTTDDLQTGISERTVFDPVSSGVNSSTGTVTFEGGYIGLVSNDNYHLEITTSGEVGDSKFTFFRDSDPLSVFGPFRTKRSGILLSDGVTVSFSEGIYIPGDKWSVVVKSPSIFEGNVSWPFKTGSGSIATIPDTTATSVIGDPISTTATSSSTTTSFTISATEPEDGDTNLTIPASEYTIDIAFNTDIDTTSVVSGVDVSVLAESVTGDTDVDALGLLVARPVASGTSLSIIVASGQLKQNNLITVTLDKTIQSTGGISLGSDYEFSFTTQYYPMYCTLRRLRLLIGAFIGEVASDTINLAIHIASLEADSLTWNQNNLDDDYYKFVRSQWTCCRAAEILLLNTIGGSGSLKAKRLGDLEVEYDTSNTSTQEPLRRVQECQLKWEGALMAGGRQVQTAQYVVKGEYDLDKPPVGRGWLHTRDIYNNQVPAGNRRIKLFGTRRYRNIHTRTSSRRGWWQR